MSQDKTNPSTSKSITTKIKQRWQATWRWTRKPKVKRAAKNTAVFLGGAATTAIVWAAKNSKYFTK